MKVYQAIGKVSAALSHSGISKARKNQQQGYNFRGIDDVLNALSTALVEAQLVILPRCTERIVIERQTQKGGALFNVTCHVEFDLVSTEDGSKHTVSTYGEAMDSADKATNKAMSAAYKYLALLVFCIPTEATADNDADFSTPEVAARINLNAPDRLAWIADRKQAINGALNSGEMKRVLAAAIAVTDAEGDEDAAKQLRDCAAAKVAAAATRQGATA